MWKSKYENEILNRFPEKYSYLRNQLKMYNEKGTKKQSKVLEIIRGKDIRDRFLKTFSETKRKMLMVSPWISNAVVDDEMIERLQKFAEQNKTLYISWGIAKNKEKEDRSPSNALLEKLTSIKHADGTQAIFVRWFGNQHNKEIVIDKRKHLLGSFNWLSYRGEYNVRQESIVVMNDDKIINDTTEYIELKFIQALERELSDLCTYNITEINPIQFINWMKELIILDSFFEKRKLLSNKLIDYLLKSQQENILHEIACMWVRYDCEDFGVRNYLSHLLSKGEFDIAKKYYELCKQYLQLSKMWGKSPELKNYSDWIDEQNKLAHHSKKKSKHCK